MHMPHGEGDCFRDDTTAGRYRRVLPTCDGLFWVSAGEKNVHHWRHRTTPSVEHSAETMWHLTSKAVLADFARAQEPGAVVHHDDKFTPARNKPDVWVQWNVAEGAGAGDVAFEAQHSAISTPGLKCPTPDTRTTALVPATSRGHRGGDVFDLRPRPRPGWVDDSTRRSGCSSPPRRLRRRSARGGFSGSCADQCSTKPRRAGEPTLDPRPTSDAAPVSLSRGALRCCRPRSRAGNRPPSSCGNGEAPEPAAPRRWPS